VRDSWAPAFAGERPNHLPGLLPLLR